MSRWQKRQERRWKWVFFVLATVLAGVVGIVVMVMRDAEALHPEKDTFTLCPSSERISEEHLVLIDVTDSLNVLQRRIVQNVFSNLQERVPRFARIHLYPIDRSNTPLPEPALVLCNPGRPEDLDDLSVFAGLPAEWVSNPNRMRELWERAFNQRIDSVFATESRLSSAPESRIMETLRGASIEAFGRTESDRARPRYVHIFSDMLQNSERYSHYNGLGWSQDRAAALADPGRLGTQALKGAEIDIYLIDRPVMISRFTGLRGELILFWDRFFSEQGAIVSRVERIEG